MLVNMTTREINIKCRPAKPKSNIARSNTSGLERLTQRK